MLLYKRKNIYRIVHLYSIKTEQRKKGSFLQKRRLILALAPFYPFDTGCDSLRLTPRWSLPRSAQRGHFSREQLGHTSPPLPPSTLEPNAEESSIWRSRTRSACCSSPLVRPAVPSSVAPLQFTFPR